jgi:amino acid transporter
MFFMAFSYIEILGFRGLSVPFDKSTAPINDLASSIGLSFIGVVNTFGAVISLFACALASVNASARIMFRMGRYGVLHNKLGAAHQQKETPHHATTISSPLMFFFSAIPVLMGISVFDMISTMATVATLGFLLVYILISIAAPVYLHSLRELRGGHILIAIASILFLLIPTIATFYPLPAAPADKFPFYFGAYMLVGIVWFVWLRLTSSGVIERIRQDLKSVQTAQ